MQELVYFSLYPIVDIACCFEKNDLTNPYVLFTYPKLCILVGNIPLCIYSRSIIYVHNGV